MAAIPWEFLYDESTNTFLANDPTTALSRYIDLPLRKQDIKPASLPLKMLLAISSPKDLPALDAEGEAELIKEALQDHIKSGQVEFDVLTKATLVEIYEKLNENLYNIFHFIGHGVFENGKGYIALIDENSHSKLLDDQHFANLFLGKRGLGLVILNSCEGAAKSSSQVFAGMAPRLVQKGIPAVIAMQYSIRDSTAKLFSDSFYRSLALAKPVDEAVQSTRNLISIDVGLDKRDFATPVLYMRAKNGVIIDLAKFSSTEKIKPKTKIWHEGLSPERQHDAELLRIKLDGLRDQLKIQTINLNSLQVEKAKYGTEQIPIRLKTAISDIEIEIEKIESQIDKVKVQISSLEASAP